VSAPREEVTGLLRLDAAGACAETRELAVHKLALIERKLTDLAAMREGLSALVAKCDTGDSLACPIIQVLSHDDVLRELAHAVSQFGPVNLERWRVGLKASTAVGCD